MHKMILAKHAQNLVMWNANLQCDDSRNDTVNKLQLMTQGLTITEDLSLAVKSGKVM